MKRALITGITGQDGAYLAAFLLARGYGVVGTYRRTSSPNFWRLQDLGILEQVTLVPADMSDMSSLLEAVTVAQPDEIYNLAAQSFVSASFDQPLHTTDIDGSGAVRLLEIIRHLKREIRFYQASTSELYGSCAEALQGEDTRFWPNSPYACAKLLSFHNTRIYREAYGLFACNGILFNHESPLRGLEFVTRKVSNAVAKIKMGLLDEIQLGNLDAKRDWGYAPEYVEAMWLMLQQDTPADYVCATGETHSVAELVQVAFEAAGLDWERHVRTDQKLIRPKDVEFLCGNADKLREATGWEPKTRFRELVGIMVEADLQRWQRYKAGDAFPWDALSYPGEVNLLKRSPN